jgi:flagellar biosynthesis chaperone FliJ
MMLYRKQAGPPRLWLMGGVATAALVLGFLGGRFSAPQPTLQRVLKPAAQHLRQAAGALDIVALEYAQARAGETASQVASLKAVQDARTQGAQAAPLTQLYPAQFQRLDLAFAQLEQAVQQQPTAQINGRVEQVRTALGSLISSARAVP